MTVPNATGGRGIDHVVLCVADLELARRRWWGLGFTVTPLARHPWGTVNHLVLLQGNFVELLAVGDRAAIPRTARGFSFGAFNQAFLDRHQGMSMLVFDSRDARADRAGFAAAGLRTYPVFDFQRSATLPDGSRRRVGFSLAFVTDPRLPDAAFFTCQQHTPELFWLPEYQIHENGASQIREVVMVAADPQALRDLYVGLQGSSRVVAGDGLRVVTTRGSIAVVTPDTFVRRFGGNAWPESADPPASPRFAACSVAVRDLDVLEALLQERGVPHERRGSAVGVGTDYLFGLALEFVPAA
jgi:hypothetical protein